jgi:hypothetical protein
MAGISSGGARREGEGGWDISSNRWRGAEVEEGKKKRRRESEEGRFRGRVEGEE